MKLLKQYKRASTQTSFPPFTTPCLSVRLLGYCGADIKAVCGEAALCALRRRYPQIYSSSQKLLLDVSTICIGSRDFLSAMRRTVPASQRAVASPAKALTPVVQPLMGAALKNVLEVLGKLFPHVEQGLKRKKDSGGSRMTKWSCFAPFYYLVVL